MNPIQYATTAFYRDGAEPDIYYGTSLVALKSQGRELVKWENTYRVVIVSDDGEMVFNELGDFVE